MGQEPGGSVGIDLGDLSWLVKQAAMLPRGEEFEHERMNLVQKISPFMFIRGAGLLGIVVKKLRTFITNIKYDSLAPLHGDGMEYVREMSVEEIQEALAQACHSHRAFDVLSTLMTLEYDEPHLGGREKVSPGGGSVEYLVPVGLIVKAGAELEKLAKIDPEFVVVGPGLESYMGLSLKGMNVNCTEMLSYIMGTLERLGETRGVIEVAGA